MTVEWHVYEIDGGPSGMYWNLEGPPMNRPGDGTFAGEYRSLEAALASVAGHYRGQTPRCEVGVWALWAWELAGADGADPCETMAEPTYVVGLWDTLARIREHVCRLCQGKGRRWRDGRWLECPHGDREGPFAEAPA